MGDVLTGMFGGGSRTEQETQADPISQQMNAMRLAQLQELFSTGGFGEFAWPRTGDVYSPSPGVGDLYGSATLSDVSPITGAVGSALNTPVDRSNLMSLQDYINMGLNETGNYVSQVATPQIMSMMALQGLEGSGAVPEAIAKATAGIGLPFVQGLPGASSTLSLLPGQQDLLRSQNAATLAGMLSPYTARDVGLAQRAGGLFNFADYGRQLQEQDLLRRQGVVTTGLTGLPYTPGSFTEGRKTSQPMFNWFGQG